MNYYGKYDQVHRVIKEEKIEEIIIALESSEHETLKTIINDLSDHRVSIKVIPDMYGHPYRFSENECHFWSTSH